MSDFQIVEQMFSELFLSRRIPHAVVIEGGTDAMRKEAARYLSQYAVCCGENRPCGVCKHCIKAKGGGHSDIYTPKLSGKTGIISVDTIRELIKDASIICNEADTKVFVLHDVDKCMPEISQNAFLKILEEPPQSTLFILTAESAKKLLSTILSRVQVFTLKSDKLNDSDIDQSALDIVNGILSPTEADLLFALSKLNDRAKFRQTLNAVSEYLRQGLYHSVGNPPQSDTASAIAKKLTKNRIIGLIELTSKAVIRADRNVNMVLLTTWLCGEYRRISWQR